MPMMATFFIVEWRGCAVAAGAGLSGRDPDAPIGCVMKMLLLILSCADVVIHIDIDQNVIMAREPRVIHT